MSPSDTAAPVASVERLNELLARRAAREARFQHEAGAFKTTIETLNARLESLKEKHARGLVWLDGEIAALATLIRNDTGVRHWRLPFGEVGFRRSPTQYEWPEKDDGLVAYIEALPENVVRPEIEIVKKVPKRTLREWIEATGIIPDGVEVKAPEERVTIKCDAAFSVGVVDDEPDEMALS